MISVIVKLLELEAMIVFGLASSSSCFIAVRFNCNLSGTFCYENILSATFPYTHALSSGTAYLDNQPRIFERTSQFIRGERLDNSIFMSRRSSSRDFQLFDVI
jgi:hypothetical protein